MGEFLGSEGAGFTHVRGRRRIGKTELLKRVQADQPNCFYFMGRDREANRLTLKRFAREWDAFVGKRRLQRLKAADLNWDELFREVGDHAALSMPDAPFILMLDEVQWLAKRGIGFSGLIKEHWADWKKTGRFKLILSGSSNRFFQEQTDGAEAILRGLRTHATITVRPFTLVEVRQYYFPAWTDEEVCLIYMMLGGVPYYLENIQADGNFIRAVNRSIFCRGGIFLEEVDAILRLEVARDTARKRVVEILASLGQDGATEAAIAERTGEEQSYVHKILGWLQSYKLVYERGPFGERKKNRAGVRYHMRDFYLNFYFQILRPFESRIRGNAQGMIFSPEVVGSGEGYYIRDFSGKAFELLVGYVVGEGRDDESLRTQPLFDKLGLCSGRYAWGTYWRPGKTQIDLVVEGKDDREIRIIEAKWISRAVHAGSTYPEQVLGKVYPTRGATWRQSRYLALSKGFSVGFRDKAADKGVRIIELGDLF